MPEEVLSDFITNQEIKSQFLAKMSGWLILKVCKYCCLHEYVYKILINLNKIVRGRLSGSVG